MKSNRFELEIEGKLENLSVISDFIAKAMKKFGVDSASIFKVQMAVDEACTNIIQYAYSEQKGVITLICKLIDDDFIVAIRDRGKPFNPNSVPSPDLEADLNKRRVGGLGMYLMRKLMDEVSYNFNADKENEVIMKKRLLKRRRRSKRFEKIEDKSKKIERINKEEV